MSKNRSDRKYRADRIFEKEKAFKRFNSGFHEITYLTIVKNLIEIIILITDVLG